MKQYPKEWMSAIAAALSTHHLQLGGVESIPAESESSRVKKLSELEGMLPGRLMDALYMAGALKPIPEPREIWACLKCERYHIMRPAGDRCVWVVCESCYNAGEDARLCNGEVIKMREVKE